jgi:hypothetical protein
MVATSNSEATNSAKNSSTIKSPNTGNDSELLIFAVSLSLFGYALLIIVARKKKAC